MFSTATKKVQDQDPVYDFRIKLNPDPQHFHTVL
jgi:hypothetical protein